MKKLIVILLFSIIIKALFFNTSVYTNEDNIQGFITKYEIKENKIMLYIEAKEKIMARYYFKSEYEKKKILSDIELGSQVYLRGMLEEPSKNTNFNLFNYKNYLLSKKIKWIFNIENIKVEKNKKWFYKIKNNIVSKINKSKNKDYFKLFILGENTIETEINDSLKLNGINHLFAISGMHITLFSGVLLFILKKLFKNNYIIILIISFFLLFYAFLANFSISVMRSLLLFIILNIKKLFKLNISTSNLIIILFLCFLIYNPFYIYDTGFLYSFIISFTLIKIRVEGFYLKKILFTSIISFYVSMPITINSSFSLNFLSPLLNILYIPFVSFILFPLSIISFFVPKLEMLFSFFIKFLETTSILFSNFTFLTFVFCKIPIYIFVVYYVFIFKSLKEKKGIIVIIVFLIIHYNIRVFIPYASVTLLDVGQGDSILLNIENNKDAVLIDTGGKYNYNMSKNIIIPYLKALGVHKLQYLIITHGDFDHMGEAINLANSFKVENVIFNCGPYNELEQELIKVLDKKKIKYYSCIKELNIGKYKLEFLNTKEYDNENDNSNVIYFNYNNYKFLFMGDAGTEKEKDILEDHNLKNVDFIKIGHHGSNTSSSKYFIDRLRLKYSLISVGKNNRYGHPKQEVLETLKNSKVYRTDLDGSIEIKLNKNGYKIRTCPP